MAQAKSTVAVPVYDLDASIEFARQITNDGHGAQLKADTLASRLGYSKSTSGAFIRRRISAQAFGLVEGWGLLNATDLAYRIIFPVNSADEASARIAAFRRIPIFNDFFQAFKGQKLPDDEGAANALISRWKVPQSEAKTVYRKLKQSAEEAWLFKESPDRLLEPAGSALAGSMPKNEPAKEGNPAPAQVPPAKEVPPATDQTFRFPLILEGPLEMLPPKQAWTEPELAQWLQLFELSLRVYYKLPKDGGSD